MKTTAEVRLKVLFATDGSACATRALERALSLVAHEGLELVVASVATYLSAQLDAPEAAGASTYAELVELSQQHAREAASQALARVEAAGVSGRIVLGQGDPVEQILKLAHVEAPDLVVVGSHGRAGLKRALLGSVSESILHGWHGAVLVIREAPP